MKTQIVYALIASNDDLFLQEIWASVYSLRHYEPDREVRVCCDETTAKLVYNTPKLAKMFTEIVVIPTPEEYSPKLRSRHVKTLVRQFVTGPFLYIDTDTIICAPLNEIDDSEYDIAGVPEGNISFDKNIFRDSVIKRVKRVFNYDASHHPHWINGGVIYAADNQKAHVFYQKWHENWNYSTFKKQMSQDMPALLKTEVDTGIMISELPGYFNAQPFMSMSFFGEAKILHFLHSFFPEDKSFCPYFDKSIYIKIKEIGDITPEIGNLILHAKSSITSPSMMVGERTLNFMTSTAAPIFEKIYSEGGFASWLMQKMAVWLGWLHKYTKKK